MDAQLAHDQFIHIRIIIGIVTGLSVTRLLTGLARFVQHPVRDRIYLVHLGWALFLLLAIVHFWWFEFGLQRIEIWTFEMYLFVICYAALFFFLCALLFPDRMDEYSGFAEYFHSRQKWFYGLLGALFLADLFDTAIRARSISARSASDIRSGRPRCSCSRSPRCSSPTGAITARSYWWRSGRRSIGSSASSRFWRRRQCRVTLRCADMAMMAAKPTIVIPG